MVSRRRVYQLLVLSLASMGIWGCVGQSLPASPSQSKESRQTALVEGLALGQGYFGATLEPRERCVNDDVDVIDSPRQPSVRSFYVYESGEIDFGLSQRLSSQELEQIDSRNYEEDINQIVESLVGSPEFDAQIESHRILVSAIELSTVERGVGLIPQNPFGDGTPGICSQISSSGERGEEVFADFVEKCGDRFLGSERLGGYVFLVADLRDVSTDERYELEEILGLDSSVGYRPESNSLADELLGSKLSVNFTIVLPKTFKQPDIVAGIDLNNASVADVSRLLYRLEGLPAYALSQQQVNSPNYGYVLEQRMWFYTTGYVESCSGLELPDDYTCYASFLRERDKSIGDGAGYRLKAKKKRLEWILQNPDRVSFAGQKREAIKAYTDWIEDYDQCVVDIENQGRRCDKLAEIGVMDNFCGECQMPSNCRATELVSLYDALPSVTIVSLQPLRKPVKRYGLSTSGDRVFSSLSSEVCALSAVAGKFDSVDQAVALRINGVAPSNERLSNLFTPSEELSKRWELRIRDSYDSEVDAFIRAASYCTPLSNFDAPSQLKLHASMKMETLNSREQHDLVPAHFASYLTGFSGNFEGGGEFVSTAQSKTAQINTEFALGSQQGRITGQYMALGFEGLTAPLIASYEVFDLKTLRISKRVAADDLAVEIRGEVSIAEKRLARTEEAFCVLTSVSGDFDGAAESVRLRRGQTHWFLEAKSGCETYAGVFGTQGCLRGKHVSARAICYNYKQR